jgi:hypothetical protein
MGEKSRDWINDQNAHQQLEATQVALMRTLNLLTALLLEIQRSNGAVSPDAAVDLTQRAIEIFDEIAANTTAPAE